MRVTSFYDPLTQCTVFSTDETSITIPDSQVINSKEIKELTMIIYKNSEPDSNAMVSYKYAAFNAFTQLRELII